MTDFPELHAFDKRQTMKVTATLVRPCAGGVRGHVCDSTRIDLAPMEGETVAQFAARSVTSLCTSLDQIRGAHIELRMVPEGEGTRG